jgi:hypothetical protein
MLKPMKSDHKIPDVPLPGTLWFVLVMGICYAVGWFALYELMRSRW